ncbi:peptidoglycan editing factor PgeF [Demequina sediminicola]|uniref:peptidoglycan editing factor PgeF n=1 Tax=Demequina sediminicola TaxID=1095026 RepID=UPI0007819B06|nr:peptidoglycan editing factor PgeF [Demequina sediminicola]
MIDAGLMVRAFFTTREGGVSESPYDSLNVASHVGDLPSLVHVNRDRVADMAGAPVSFMTAYHGTEVIWVSDPGDTPAEGDILITATPGVALGALAADCVPVLFHDTVSGTVAAVHAGRRGMATGAIEAAVDALLRAGGEGTSPESLHASIGPAVCGRCYEVPEELRSEVSRQYPSAHSETTWGTPSLDLPAAIASTLGDMGLTTVHRSQICTIEDPRMFSHRRDGVTGRFAGVIVHA